MKIVKALTFVGCLAIALPVGATTLTYEYTSTSSDGGPGAGIAYTLGVDSVTGAGTFTIDGAVTANEVWRAGWFTFKFVGGSTPSDLGALTYPTATGPWSIADVNENTDVKVLQGATYNTLLAGSSSGFYVTSLASPAPDDPTQGICLTYLMCDPDLPLSFSFTVALPSGWNPDDVPFQVGFYDGETKKFKLITNQLSRDLAEIVTQDLLVPDGGTTLTLLGLGMVGLLYVRRRNA